jgi:hypothetical protein
MFSMWSDPSLLRNNGKVAFSTGSVPRQQWGQPCFLRGLFPGYITSELQVRGQLSVSEVSDGKGCHKG